MASFADIAIRLPDIASWLQQLPVSEENINFEPYFAPRVMQDSLWDAELEESRFDEHVQTRPENYGLFEQDFEELEEEQVMSENSEEGIVVDEPENTGEYQTVNDRACREFKQSCWEIGRIRSLRVFLPSGSSSVPPLLSGQYSVRIYNFQPPHQPPLCRNVPVRVSISPYKSCYIFPSFGKSSPYMLGSSYAFSEHASSGTTSYYTVLSIRSKSTTSTFFTSLSTSGVVLTGPSRPATFEASEYYRLLHSNGLVLPRTEELDWSGKGQHVEYSRNDNLPLQIISHIGASQNSIVERVRCRRVVLARKKLKCWRRWTLADSMNEVSHLHRLRHAHIVQLVGTYFQNRIFAILMYPAADQHLGEYMEDLVEAKKGLSTGRDQSMVEDLRTREDSLAACIPCLASALAYIHKSTTKHLDIKPANLLLKRVPKSLHREGNPEYRVYVADFGLSQSFESQDNSQMSQCVGQTPTYCAPEIHAGEAHGRAADVFSLACVFAEIFTVLAGLSLDEFIEFRRGEPGGSKAYHLKLVEVKEWVVKSCFRAAVPLNLVNYLRMMLSSVPSERPKADDLVKLFQEDTEILSAQFRTRGCCSRSPEPYVIE